MASLRGEALGGTRPPKNCYGLQETESSRLDYTQLFTRPNSPTLNIFLKSVYTCDITGWDCHPGAWNKPLTVCASGYPLLIRSSFSLMFRRFKGLFTRHDCRIRLFILVYLINWLEWRTYCYISEQIESGNCAFHTTLHTPGWTIVYDNRIAGKWALTHTPRCQSRGTKWQV